MSRHLSLVFLVLLCLQPHCGGFTDPINRGFTDPMDTPSQLLAESRLKKELSLTNGREIYQDVADLFDQPGVVEPKRKGMSSSDVSLAWEGNPMADKKVFTVKFTPGTTVLDAIRQIATRRGERVTKSQNYVAITTPERLPARATYQLQEKEPAAGLERHIIAVIPTRIFIRGSAADDVEDFISFKLQETWTLSNKVGVSPFRVKMVGTAKEKSESINVIGTWTYEDLFQAIGLIVDLRWQMDGTNVNLLDGKKDASPQ